jgi:hypothetical protein
MSPGAVVLSGVDGSVLHALSIAVGSLAGAGDVDGDGYDDLIVGTWSSGNGYVTLFSGASGLPLWTHPGSLSSQCFGYSVAGGGDVDGDGLDDVLVGAPHQGGSLGRVKILSGLTGVTIRTIYASSNGLFGRSVASVGDVDGDAVPDIAVGDTSAGAGRISLHSAATGVLLWNFNAVNPVSALGEDVAAVGDIDGDGVPDVGAWAWSNHALVLSGASATAALIHLIYIPGAGGDKYAISGLGDANADGIPDFAARGSVYSGANAGLLSAYSPNGYVASVGDLSGDGISDLAVGAGGAVKVYACIAGVSFLGEGTSGCSGPLDLAVNSMPQVANLGFALSCTNAGADNTGILGLSDAGSSQTILGAAVWIDVASPAFFFLPAQSDAAGMSQFAVPITADPVLAGVGAFVQFAWPDPCAPGYVATSNGLTVTIQP